MLLSPADLPSVVEWFPSMPRRQQERKGGDTGRLEVSSLQGVTTCLLVLAYPWVANWSVERFRWLSWFSPVVQCYLFGILLANLPFDLVHEDVSKVLMMASVPLAIPLLLFSTNFQGWLRLAPRTVLSFVLAMVATMVVATLAALWLSVPGAGSWKVSGMMVGVYTGGTPNMSAIGWALKVEENTFILINAVDMALGGAFFLFLMTGAKPLLSRFLPPFPAAGDVPESDHPVSAKESRGRASRWKGGTAALGLSVVVVLISAGIAFGFTRVVRGPMPTGAVFDQPTFNSTIVIAISLLAIGGSFVSRIRTLPGSYALGDYLILVFCVAIGSQANVGQLADAGVPYFIYVGFVMFGAVVLHLLLATVFRIDVETMIITSTAAIYGPAFIGPVARALKNRQILVSGIASAMVGLALGTQLGLLLAYALQP